MEYKNWIMLLKLEKNLIFLIYFNLENLRRVRQKRREVQKKKGWKVRKKRSPEEEGKKSSEEEVDTFQFYKKGWKNPKDKQIPKSLKKLIILDLNGLLAHVVYKTDRHYYDAEGGTQVGDFKGTRIIYNLLLLMLLVCFLTFFNLHISFQEALLWWIFGFLL